MLSETRRWQKERSGSYRSGSHSRTEVITETATHKFMLNEEWGSGRMSEQSSTNGQIVTLRYNSTDSNISLKWMQHHVGWNRETPGWRRINPQDLAVGHLWGREAWLPLLWGHNSPCLLLVSWATTLEKVLPSRKLTLEELKRKGAKWIAEFSKVPPNHDGSVYKRLTAAVSEAVS